MPSETSDQDRDAALAIKLFENGKLTLAQAAKMAGISIEEMIERVGAAGVDVVRHSVEQLDADLAVMKRHGRGR